MGVFAKISAIIRWPFSRKNKDASGDVDSVFSPSAKAAPPLAGRDRTLTDLLKLHFRNRLPKSLSFRNRPTDAPPSALGVPPSEFAPHHLEWLVLFFLILLLAFFSADLGSLFIDKFLPAGDPVKRSFSNFGKVSTLEDFKIIFSRNLFNSKGVIPGEEKTENAIDLNNVPIKTSLPITLIGTVILNNELRSIATIQDTQDNRVLPLKVDDEVPGKLKVIQIEPYRMVFLNLSSSRREYVELPENLTQVPEMSIRAGATAAPKSAGQFSVARTEIDRALANMGELLTQAKADPYFENGQMAGFIISQVARGSLYEKLGIKNGDIICGVNGDPVTDVSKAMELVNALRSSSNIELCIKRGGKQSTQNYDIK